MSKDDPPDKQPHTHKDKGFLCQFPFGCFHANKNGQHDTASAWKWQEAREDYLAGPVEIYTRFYLPKVALVSVTLSMVVRQAARLTPLEACLPVGTKDAESPAPTAGVCLVTLTGNMAL